MNEHPTRWLEAYLDGELPLEKREQIGAHLIHCPVCTSELENLRRLSGLLFEVPEIKLELPHLVLPGRQVHPAAASSAAQSRQPAVKYGWLVFPLGLLTVWVFIQAALWISSGLLSLDATREFFLASPGLSDSLQRTLGFLLLPAPISWVQTLVDNLPDYINWQLLSIQLISSAACCILFAGWLAGWFSFTRHSQPITG